MSESEPQPVEESESQPVEESELQPVAESEPVYNENSHLFAVRTTGGQEKVVLRLLEAKMRTENINVQSILLVDNLKGYVVVEAQDPQHMFNAIQGIRHVKGQLRGELQFSEIESYLIRKSTVSELAVDGTVEVIGGPFKGMKATITRVDHDKEEATVILLDAPYQLPVTVDANYLKPVKT
ncbi:transcription elongation factor Spt5 [Candidatus Nitrosopelagicus sp.]|nr:transcription elongation factor Spt5 [Candidatus Nitrosopelagicus sp.]